MNKYVAIYRQRSMQDAIAEDSLKNIGRAHFSAFLHAVLPFMMIMCFIATTVCIVLVIKDDGIRSRFIDKPGINLIIHFRDDYQ